jgi:phosphate transport system permease protein
MRKSDWVGKVLFICASISTLVVFLITFYLLREGVGVLNWSFLTGITWNPTIDLYGIIPTLISTLIIVAGAVVIAVAIAIPSAIFLAEFSPFWLRNIIKSAAEVIVGIPSVVIGLFGVIVIVPFIRDNIGGRNGESILAGWIVLALMIIPNILTISEDALRAVPSAYREASLAMGATQWQTVRNVLLPSASSGIRASLILGVGRALGETMAVMMVIGNPNIPFIPTSILDQVRTLTSTIALEFSYVSWGSGHQQALYAMGAVLFFIVMALNFVATFVIRRKVVEGE